MDFYLGFFFTWKVNAGKVGVLNSKYIHTLFTYSHTSLRWESSKYYYAVNVDFARSKSPGFQFALFCFFSAKLMTLSPMKNLSSYPPTYLYILTQEKDYKNVQVAQRLKPVLQPSFEMMFCKTFQDTHNCFSTHRICHYL